MIASIQTKGSEIRRYVEEWPRNGNVTFRVLPPCAYPLRVYMPDIMYVCVCTRVEVANVSLYVRKTQPKNTKGTIL